ncbi:hypothetical protein ADUPG1_011644, partial [Aduncisulcus paluster]
KSSSSSFSSSSFSSSSSSIRRSSSTSTLVKNHHSRSDIRAPSSTLSTVDSIPSHEREDGNTMDDINPLSSFTPLSFMLNRMSKSHSSQSFSRNYDGILGEQESLGTKTLTKEEIREEIAAQKERQDEQKKWQFLLSGGTLSENGSIQSSPSHNPKFRDGLESISSPVEATSGASTAESNKSTSTIGVSTASINKTNSINRTISTTDQIRPFNVVSEEIEHDRVFSHSSSSGLDEEYPRSPGKESSKFEKGREENDMSLGQHGGPIQSKYSLSIDSLPSSGIKNRDISTQGKRSGGGQNVVAFETDISHSIGYSSSFVPQHSTYDAIHTPRAFPTVSSPVILVDAYSSDKPVSKEYREEHVHKSSVKSEPYVEDRGDGEKEKEGRKEEPEQCNVVVHGDVILEEEQEGISEHPFTALEQISCPSGNYAMGRTVEYSNSTERDDSSPEIIKDDQEDEAMQPSRCLMEDNKDIDDRMYEEEEEEEEEEEREEGEEEQIIQSPDALSSHRDSLGLYYSGKTASHLESTIAQDVSVSTAYSFLSLSETMRNEQQKRQKELIHAEEERLANTLVHRDEVIQKLQEERDGMMVEISREWHERVTELHDSVEIHKLRVDAKIMERDAEYKTKKQEQREKCFQLTRESKQRNETLHQVSMRKRSNLLADIVACEKKYKDDQTKLVRFALSVDDKEKLSLSSSSSSSSSSHNPLPVSLLSSLSKMRDLTVSSYMFPSKKAQILSQMMESLKSSLASLRHQQQVCVSLQQEQGKSSEIGDTVLKLELQKQKLQREVRTLHEKISIKRERERLERQRKSKAGPSHSQSGHQWRESVDKSETIKPISRLSRPISRREVGESRVSRETRLIGDSTSVYSSSSLSPLGKKPLESIIFNSSNILHL